MKRIPVIALVLITFVSLLFVSWASSQGVTTIAKGNDISKYKYVVFGDENNGDAELADIVMVVQNDISEKLQVVSSQKANALISEGVYVLTTMISVQSEKWNGGHTYITVSFYDFATNQSVAVVKSSGIGMSILHDQELACKAFKKELDKTFK